MFLHTNLLVSIFIKSILARKFCIQTINWQKQIAREISIELQSVTLSLNSESVTSLEVGRASPESKSYTSLKNVKCTIKYEVMQVALHKEDLLFCKVFKSLSRLEA